MYEEYFGLSGAPFKLNPDPRFFFGSRSHNKAMAYLHYGLKQAEGFIVITGPIGAGKSMLISHLLDQINRSNVVAAHLLTANVAPDELLGHVLSAFRIEPEGEGRTGQLEAFEDYLFDQLNRGRRVLLIMDEAQNLPRETLEELRMLSNIDYDGTPLFQVFLVGQPEFRDTIASSSMEQLKQRVIASYHLEGLSEEETKEYILHRLSVAGWQEDPTFTDEAFGLIFEETDGRPRRINTLCNRLMLYCSMEKHHEINGATVKLVIAELHEEKLGSTEARQVSLPPVRSVDEPQTEELDQVANGDVIVSIESARAKVQASKSKAGQKAEKTAKKKTETEDMVSDANGEGRAMEKNETENSKEPLAGLTPLPVSRSVFDRLRAKRDSDLSDTAETPPQEATLTDVASAIAEASAGSNEEAPLPADDLDQADSEVLASLEKTDAAIEPLATGAAAEWRKSVVRSINDTRSELKQAHANVQRLRRNLSDLDKRRGVSRAKIAASLSRAESLLSEIRDAWR